MIQAVDHPCKVATASWDHKLSTETEVSHRACLYILQSHGLTREHAWAGCAVCPLCNKLGTQPIKHHHTFPSRSQLAKTISFRMGPRPGSGSASTLPLVHVQYMPISGQSGIFMHGTSFVVDSSRSANLSPDSVQLPLSMPLTRGKSGSTQQALHPRHPMPNMQGSATCRMLPWGPFHQRSPRPTKALPLRSLLVKTLTSRLRPGSGHGSTSSPTWALLHHASYVLQHNSGGH